MASTKSTLNPLTDTPELKTDITKPFMLAYMRSEKATAEDRAWFKQIVSNPDNQKEYVNNISGEKYTDIDIPKVREAFGKRFYPQIYTKKKTNKTFIDCILDL